MNKLKEQSKKKNIRDNNLLDLDNEIIIGIKTLPNEKNKKTKKVVSKKRKNTKEKFKTNDIEDISLNARKNTKKNTKKKKKLTPKQQEIAKQKRKRVFRTVKWTSLVVIIAGGIIAFMLSSFFNIKSVTVTGNEKITSEEIISLSNITLEENTFKISNSKVEEAVKTNAYIESVKLKRKLPDEIEIQVSERKPAYMLTLGNAYVYVSTQGYLLEVSTTKLDLPIITGISTKEEEIQEGNRLCTEDLQRLNSVIQIIDSASSNDIAKLITKVNISDKQDYVLELKKEKKTVHLGDTSNLSTKMLYVKTMLEKEKKKEGDIFVNTDLNSKGAIFREKV